MKIDAPTSPLLTDLTTALQAAPRTASFPLGLLLTGFLGAFTCGSADALQVSEPFNQSLAAPSPAPLARFGTSVAVTGPTAVVGAPGDAAAGPDAGVVHVFLRDDASGAYELAQAIRPPGLSPFDRFGGAVAVGGNLLVIGAKGDDEAAPNAGAAYIYRRFGLDNPFMLVGKLLPPSGGVNDCFGVSVAALGNRFAVGAPRADVTAFDAGALYTYTFDFAANQFFPAGEVLDPDGSAGDGFGSSVAIAPGVLCVGATRLDAPTGLQNTGGVIVYEDFGVNGQVSWSKVQTIQPAGLTAFAEFGATIAMEPPRIGVSGTLIVGAPELENPVTGTSKGAAYVYESGLPLIWSEAFSYGIHEPGSGNRLGSAVAIDGNVALVGAPGSVPVDSMDDNVGHVDLLRRDAGGSWSQ
ncbi:MAG: FG-GAP repeat protein, partial [Planctomycetota bacterium]